MTAKSSILIVDDEVSNCRLLADLVRREGYDAYIATGGAEALEILLHDRPDLVLLDMMMPEVDGMAVLTELQKRQLVPELPVVVVTANDDRQTRINALTAGATDFLTKPIDRVEVACRIRTLIELKRLRQMAVNNATDALLADVRDAVGSLPLVLYRAPYLGDSAATDTPWVVGNLQQLTGLTQESFFAHKPWIDLIHVDDREHYMRKVQAAHDGGSPGFAEPFRLVRSESDVRWLLNVATFDATRRTQTGALLDITAQKNLESSLIQAQKMEAFGQLASGVAHDFNNILSVILSLGGTVRDALPESDEMRDDIVEVLKAANRGVGLTKQLLTFSRHQVAEPVPTDLNESVTQLYKLLARTLGGNVTLAVTPSAQSALVRIDPVQFDQIVLNLAVNARDAMPQGGRLQIEIGHPPRFAGGGADRSRVRLTVTDTGTGMDAATQQRIFEPFFTTKPKGQGTGLGLATCFGIVQNASGTIRVQSAPGYGTSFIIEFPSCATSQSQVPVIVESVQPVGEGQHVLVAEDEPALRRVAVRLLENAGYKVHAAADGAEAIDVLRDTGRSLAAVVSDVVMPGCSGYDVAAMAAALAPQAAVVLTSGYTDMATAPKEYSHIPVLWKPVSPTELVGGVARAISAKHSASRARSMPPIVSQDVVLLVESDEHTSKAVTRVLAAAGYQIETLATSQEARRVLELGLDPCAVLCDLSLANESPLALLEWIGRARPALRMVTVLLSDNVIDDQCRALAESGKYHVLSKPFDPAGLLQLVGRLSGSARALTVSMRAPAKERTTDSSERSQLNRRSGSPPDVGRVLVVDDDEAIAFAYDRVLKNAGFETVVAENLVAAYRALKAGEFDVLLTDVMLPDGSGLELLGELHGSHFELPVVVITGAPSVESATQAVRGQVHEYLAKPVSTDELLRVTKSAVESGRVARLRTKLLTARFGGDELLQDVPNTEKAFARAMASIRMVYQPIVRAEDGSVYAYEALLRCDEPAFASPLRLLAAAEMLGRVNDVGRAVRASVAKTMIDRTEQLEAIFVNIHPSELVLNLLVDAADPLLPLARRVVLEVTERASIEGGPKLEKTLERLRSRGYRLAVDDLGEGYAGLTSLVTLRPDIAKIDMSLVRDVHRSPMKRDIVKALVDMARRSDITVVAEGVETLEERTALVELGCDLLQGYYFAKPGPPFPVPIKPASPAQ